jgi:glycosyltransferase involved in cell wall biosynthesis
VQRIDFGHSGYGALPKDHVRKVLVAVPYFHPRIGGLENYAYHIVNDLRSRGWEVVVVCSDSAVKSVVRETMYGCVVYRLPVWRVVSNTPVHPRWLLMLRHIVLAERPDVVNAHMPVPYMGDMAVLAARRTPAVVTYHAGSMKKNRRGTDWPIYFYEKLWLPCVLNRASAVICGSDFVRFSFLRRWLRKSVTITPAVDTGLFVPGESSKVQGRLVFVGDFRDSRKGLDVLLRAVQRLHGVSLRVVGAGEGEPQKDVEYLGVLSGRNLIREIQLAQALVLPSTTEAESFGMVLIEAMACGTAVIASRIGGVPGVVRDGVDGFLVAPNDSEALEAAIGRIVGDSDLSRTMGAAGRKRVEQEFDWAARGAVTAEILLRAAEV